MREVIFLVPRVPVARELVDLIGLQKYYEVETGILSYGQKKLVALAGPSRAKQFVMFGEAAERRLADWRFTPNGSEGFAKAEVTAGGISTLPWLVA